MNHSSLFHKILTLRHLRRSHRPNIASDCHPFSPAVSSTWQASSLSIHQNPHRSVSSNAMTTEGHKHLHDDPNCVADETTTSPAARATTPTSSDRASLLSNDDSSVESFLLSLARATSGKVERTLEKLSSNTNSVSGYKTTPSSNLLYQRWQGVFEIEKVRMSRRSSPRENTTKRLSVEQMWDEALFSSGLSTVVQELITVDKYGSLSGNNLSSLHITVPCEDDVYDGPLETPFPSATSPIHRQQISPIFEFPMNQQYQMEGIDSMHLWHQRPDEKIGDNDYGESIFGDELQQCRPTDSYDTTETLDTNKQHFNEQNGTYQDAIFRSISLLSVLHTEEWRRLQSLEDTSRYRDEARTDGERQENPSSEENGGEDSYLQESEVRMNKLSDTDAVKELFAFTNLLLAHLVVSLETDPETIVGNCIRIYNEMKLMGESGQRQCHPDATTYRILILAFSRRFMAPGEAIDLFRVMMKDKRIEITPEVFLDGMKACHAKMDLRSARAIMEGALNEKRVRPSVGSYTLLTEMMKTHDLRDETLSLFNRLHHAGLLSREAEDKLLLNICRWPRKTRRGDVVDISSLLLEVLTIVQNSVFLGQKPAMPVWIKLVEGLHISARIDPSLWKNVISALNVILESYPEAAAQRETLVNIGLEASVYGEDPNLAARILQSVSSINPRSSSGSPRARDMRIKDIGSTPVVPYKAVKSAMDVCLKKSDAKSAESIIDSIHKLGNHFPIGALAELYSLLLMCHTKVNDADKAWEDLRTMIEGDMEPR
jgi:hypothetical protein